MKHSAWRIFLGASALMVAVALAGGPGALAQGPSGSQGGTKSAKPEAKPAPPAVRPTAPAAPATPPAPSPTTPAAPSSATPPGRGGSPPSSRKTTPPPSGEETIKINFPEMDLETVLKNFSAITGKSFILEQMPKGQVRTIGPIGPIEIPRSQAFNLFILIMNMNGYSVVPTSVPGVYKVVRVAEAARENIPVYGPGRAPAPNEVIVTRFIPLKYVQATDVANQLQQLTSKAGGQVVAYSPTNTLIIVDTALNIERLIKIIRLLDVQGPEPIMEILMLRYAQASEIANIINQIYSQPAGGGPVRSATTRVSPRAGGKPAPPGTESAMEVTPSAGPTTAGLPKVIPVERINAIIIIAIREMMESIKSLVAKLDIDVGSQTTIHVYYCQHAEAKELAATLSNIAGKGRTQQTGQPSRPVSEAETPTSPRPQPSRPAATQPPTSAPTTTVISGVLSGDVTITSDDATNSLIIVASPHDFQIIQDVIQKLDIPRRQVFVEAVLLEVTYTETRDAGVSIHGASPLENGGIVFAGTGFSDVSSIGILSSMLSTGGSLTLPSGVTMGALGQPVEVPGTAGVTGVTIPSAGMVVRLLSSTSQVNVLSTPTLLTTDNKEASIEVGQKIPVPTGQTVSTGGFSNVSISRESVGIKLKITPQINESDNIRLEIFTEISGAVSSPLGIDVNTLGVTTSIKTAQTTVIVKDGQTIVIGGLMEDREDQSSSKIPFLGDIPIIGWLFKSMHRGITKTNLIILLTPHIIKSDTDMERVRRKVEADYQMMMEDTLPVNQNQNRYMSPPPPPASGNPPPPEMTPPAPDSSMPAPPNLTNSNPPSRRSATTRDQKPPP